VLICVDLRSHTIPVFRAGGNFAVNILASDQESLANRFATRSEKRATYFEEAAHYRAATGAPILEHSLGFVDAHIVAEYPGGDHVIFLGQVEALGCDGEVAFLPGVDSSLCTLPTANQSNGNGHLLLAETKPLLFYRGTYQHISSRFHHDLPDVPGMKEPVISNKETHE
jgi:flavin reductase (DIM6/NTAB) family NADH-FMN oxidoreductase RutF